MTSSPYEKFQDATIEDIAQDPHKYGAPTFEEFVANKEKYIGRSDDWFSAIDKGSSILSRRVKKQVYILKGYRVESLEKLETLAKNMGLNPWKLQPRPQIIDLGGGWCNLDVHMVDPSEVSNETEE